ncbi:MAG: hemolysin family protein, partial [Anaerolineaceae bacterium]|nr:hemolysin family protein [Anaerolineaceae bacterium]
AMLAATVVVLALEYAVEGVVLRHPESWAIRFVLLAVATDVLWRPFTWLMMRLMGSPAALQRSRVAVIEDDLKIWVEDGEHEGSLEQGERKMIYSIFQFGDTLCREIMVPRIDVTALDVNASLEEAVKGALHSGHSRLPVYEDNIDNIIGVLYAKDLLLVQMEKESGNSIRSLLRPAYFVPEAKKVDELLREMQARGVHMSIVVDEYGGMAGLVTLEDIVEEIVGEIRDEYDESEELLWQQENPDEYLFLGRIDLDDFNEILGTHITKEAADTLGGYIYAQIGRVPAGGERLEVEGWQLEVEKVSGRRIHKVRASHPQNSAAMEKTRDGTEQ